MYILFPFFFFPPLFSAYFCLPVYLMLINSISVLSFSGSSCFNGDWIDTSKW